MASINPTLDLSIEPVTRATLASMWNGEISAITTDDLAEDFLLIQTGSDFSDVPSTLVGGQLFWHKDESVMYCWTDVLDDTGVSLWLAIGPDKFEVPCLTQEPIKAGSPVELVYDRVVKEGTGHGRGMPRVFGFVQSGIDPPSTLNDGPVYGGDTAASGAWIRVGVDGIVYGKSDFASSHPSQGLVTHTQVQMLSLETDGSLPIGIIAHGAGSPNEATLRQIVGISTQWWREESSGISPTEPSYLAKFVFMPRMISQSLFS